MSWAYLMLAIAFELAGTTAMKLSEGLTRLVPSLVLFAAYGVAFVLLALALKRIDLGIAYAIWSGLGTAVAAGIGILWFGEPATALKMASLVLIVAGVAGLNLAGGAH